MAIGKHNITFDRKINKAVSISSIYLYMGVMVVNSKEVLEAQGRILERIDTVKENKQKCIYYV